MSGFFASFGSVIALCFVLVDCRVLQAANYEPNRTLPASVEAGENHALLDAPGRKAVLLKVEKSLDYLKGAFRYERLRKQRSGDIKGGMLEFTVRRAGGVFLAVSWEYDGSTRGGWTKERMTHSDLFDSGWLEVERCPWDSKRLLYYRFCKTGEKLRIRNRKYGAPSLLTTVSVDFSEAKYQSRLPVRSLMRLLHRRHLKLLESANYDELEKIARSLRKKKTKFRNGDSRLFSFYSGLSSASTEVEKKVTDGDWEKRIRQLEAWQKAKPKSITGHIVLGMCYDSYGSFARGSGWASSVSEKNAELFTERNRKSRAILHQADKTIPHSDPALYSALVSTAIGGNVPRKTVDSWVQKSVGLDPTFMSTYYAATTYLMPRWNGSPGELEKFADQIAEQTKGECGMMVYSAIVQKMSWFAMRKIFEDFRFTWEKTRQGFRDFEKKYPQARDHFDRYCYLACLSGDRKTADMLFQRIGDGYRVNQWGYQGRYRRWQYAFQQTILQGEHQTHITAHEDGVLALDYSHDGKIIATCGLDMQIRLWEIKTGKKVFVTQPGDSWAMCLDFSPKSPILVVGTRGGDVMLWDFANQRAGTLGSHRGRMRSVKFSADGKLVASVGEDNHVKVWNMETGELLKDITQPHKGRVNAACFHPDGKRLVTVGSDGKVIVTNATTGAVSSQWTVSKSDITTIAISADGKLVAVGDNRGTVSLWDINGKKKLASTKPLSQPIKSLDFSPKNNRLAIAGGGGRFRPPGGAYVWDGKPDSKPTRLKGQVMETTAVRFSPDGKMIATGSKDWSLRIWANK